MVRSSRRKRGPRACSLDRARGSGFPLEHTPDLIGGGNERRTNSTRTNLGPPMILDRLLTAALLAFSCAPTLAQPPQPRGAARAGVGIWKFSNPAGDRRCIMTFKLDAAGPGRAVTLGGSCVATFPDLRATAA